MSDDTLNLTLNGDVPLDLYARAIEHFSALVALLSQEVVGHSEIDWQIEHLQAGSAIATVRGRYEIADDVIQVVDAYGQVGEALELHVPMPFSADVSQQAYALTNLLNGKITSLSLATPTKTYNIGEPQSALAVERKFSRQSAWGSIRGEIATLVRRPKLRFVLYDNLFDKKVSCFPSDAFEPVVRESWGKRVDVTGLVFRDSETGRPLQVREIFEIKSVPDQPIDGYKRARGAIPWSEGDEPAEVLIRRLRDASD